MFEDPTRSHRNHCSGPRIPALLLVVAVGFGVGCEPASQSPPADPPIGADGDVAPQASEPEPEQEWMAAYIQDQQIGYLVLSVEPIVRDGEPLFRFRYEEELRIRRFDDTTQLRTRLESVQDGQGVLRSFRSEVLAGPSPLVTEGVHQDGQLQMTLHTEGRSERQTRDWQSDWLGFFADHQSLRNQPLRPGETRTLQVLLPVVHQLATIEMRAGAYEATPLLEDTRQLLRVDVTTELGPTQLNSVFWADREGRIWKNQDLQLDLVTYRVTREQALQPITGAGFDLAAQTLIRLDEPLRQPRSVQEVVYRAEMREGELDGLFVHDGSQQVRLLEADLAEVTVRAIRPSGRGGLEPFDGQVAAEPTAADRQPGLLIQSDDPLIVEMASEAGGDLTDAWEVACALEAYVHRIVELKNYSTALASASEVARSREGDCTEHAMLLAALCRARGLPARLAVGLVYYPPSQAFAYHMWTEVWIEGRWIGLDATLADGGIGAAHLKLGVSSMQGHHAYADMLPIVQALGRLQLEVIRQSAGG